MCFDTDSAPPIPQIAGAAVEHRDLEVVATDGNRFAAFLALPEEQARAAVLVLPDVRGLYRFYEELALRFAERGYASLVLDYYGRTAGSAKRDDDFEFMDDLKATTNETLQLDIRAAVDSLRGASSCETVFTVGFCFGGRVSWLAAAGGHGLSGAIGFYGSLGPFIADIPSPIDIAADMTCPVLALQAGVDANITPEQNRAFESALQEASIAHELVVYDGCPHSFFDRKYDEYADASEDAWNRVLSFIGRYAG